jgi:hypothetical protein
MFQGGRDGSLGHSQYHDTHSDGRLTDVTFRLISVCKGRAVPLVGTNLLILAALPYSRAIPHGDCDEGGEPEDRVERIDGEEGVGGSKSLGARPHRYHREVYYCGYGNETLRGLC